VVALTWADASRTVTWTRPRQGLGVQHGGLIVIGW
jgi:hypothetical protein